MEASFVPKFFEISAIAQERLDFLEKRNMALIRNSAIISYSKQKGKFLGAVLKGHNIVSCIDKSGKEKFNSIVWEYCLTYEKCQCLITLSNQIFAIHNSSDYQFINQAKIEGISVVGLCA